MKFFTLTLSILVTVKAEISPLFLSEPMPEQMDYPIGSSMEPVPTNFDPESDLRQKRFPGCGANGCVPNCGGFGCGAPTRCVGMDCIPNIQFGGSCHHCLFGSRFCCGNTMQHIIPPTMRLPPPPAIISAPRHLPPMPQLPQLPQLPPAPFKSPCCPCCMPSCSSVCIRFGGCGSCKRFNPAFDYFDYFG